ncbi:hypothetical protein Ngar_c11690 [Candidatus Nitrososphaera gargensis Ga9.2]|uniref:Uncharacterized protein n=1 Tax=Nitrososphaera gargensis (strain Ga9.2) TaxID=1237085 RepID=K0IMQ8_NITGG|nr:hypothetical protein Ngar_c11690 [Candidatus Nitrososphaera gargensis Ga9.2]
MLLVRILHLLINLQIILLQAVLKNNQQITVHLLVIQRTITIPRLRMVKNRNHRMPLHHLKVSTIILLTRQPRMNNHQKLQVISHHLEMLMLHQAMLLLQPHLLTVQISKVSSNHQLRM